MKADTDVHRTRRLVLRGGGALALASVATALVAKPKQRVVDVVAKKFAFVPAEIRVARGETVTLRIVAPEVPMGFSLPDFATRVDVVPGKAATLQLTPDRAGSFTFLCDVFCGGGHEDMSGTLIVT